MLVKLRQLKYFMKFLRYEIEEMFSGDRWETENICLDESFYNLNHSMPWNYKFETLIVRKYRKV